MELDLDVEFNHESADEELSHSELTEIENTLQKANLKEILRLFEKMSNHREKRGQVDLDSEKAKEWTKQFRHRLALVELFDEVIRRRKCSSSGSNSENIE